MARTRVLDKGIRLIGRIATGRKSALSERGGHRQVREVTLHWRVLFDRLVSNSAATSTRQVVMIQLFRRTVPLGVTLCAAGLLSANANPAGDESIPQLGYAYLAWSKVENAFQPIPGAGPGPVMSDKAHAGGAHPIRIADLNNPILKPW